MTDDEMFAFAEEQRALASSMTDAELAAALLGIIATVYAAEQEYVCTDEGHAQCDKERGALREAAYRLAKIRDYEKTL